ncbi:MAG: sensor histidine kinase [bacterium]|nr:sensor histidine kinase [bacterium]
MNLTDRQRALAADIFLSVGLFALSVGSVLVSDISDSPDVRQFDSIGMALIALQTIPLLWRRNAPITILTITVVGFAIDRGLNYPTSWAFIGISLAIYTVGAQLPPRRSLLVGGITIDVVLLWTAIGVFVADTVEPFALLSEIAVLGLPLLLGREAYSRQQRMIELERRAIRAEHEREQQAADAVATERVRIARELHDVVAHEITVMTIQSAGARRILDADPEQAYGAMESAEAAGHRALTEIRRLLGMLRTTDPKATDPQPGMATIDRLVDQMNSTGLPTELTIKGEERTLPLGIDLNAYRIIQESVTNTLKHGGPGVRAEIDVTYSDHELAIEVRDDGRGASAGHESTGGAGQGLVGMHERAALLNGVVTAGPRPGGGFRVSAKIPLPA